MKKITIIALVAVTLMAGCMSKEESRKIQIRDSLEILNYNLASKKQHTQDSIATAVILKRDSIKKAEEQKEFEKTPAGRIQKKHPEWSKEDCQLIADRKIWIGMDIHMLVHYRGLPNSKHVSNYGDGSQYQYCWDNYEISCFYTKEDQIVYAYN